MVKIKLKVGVVVPVATEVVKRGDNVPALNEETVALEVLHVEQAMAPAALKVIGAEAETATVPVAAGNVIVFAPAIAGATRVMFPLPDPG